MVPKRNPKMGWALNFGNPLTYLLLLVLGLVIAAILSYS